MSPFPEPVAFEFSFSNLPKGGIVRQLRRLVVALIVGQVCLLPSANSQPAHCTQDFFCLFNQEAAASDTGPKKGGRSYAVEHIPDQFAYR